MKKQYLVGYPSEVVKSLLERQVQQGNEADVSVFELDIKSHKVDGGIDWADTEEGEEFWHKVLLDKDFSDFELTAKDWLESLPENIRIEALNNAFEEIDGGDLGRIEEDLYEALIGSFIWSKSPEGFGYWDAIATVHNN